jgi:hypothetical protein
MFTPNSIFVWNCRGAANTSFYRYCKHYVDSYKPVTLVIVEIRCDPNRLRRTFTLLGFDGFIATEVEGFAGGIVVVWKEDYLKVELQCKKFQFIHLQMCYSNGINWFFSPIYASPNEDNRGALWEDLKSIAASMNAPWLLAGDFNDISSEDEKKGGAAVSLRKCNTFKKRIEDCNLMDLGSVGSKYTWRGPIFHGGQQIFERLDRAMSNENWRLMFPDGYVKVLPRVDFSDHHPILISPADGSHPIAPKQFRFESAWLLEDSYMSMLNDCWNGDAAIHHKLYNFQKNVKKWKWDTLDQVLRQKKNIMARLAGIQNCIYNGNRYGGFRRLEKKLQRELHDILKKEELMWFKRSRAQWLNDGDRNTRYYHVKTVNRRRRNNIVMLRDTSGNWTDNAAQLQGMVNDFYKHLFALEHTSNDWADSVVSYPRLEDAELLELEADIKFEEVRRAVFSMKPWKAPGPDGFPAGFFQKSWSIVGASVYDFVVKVWSNPSAIATVNQTDICLIPKIARPEFVNQFRPISLCNTIYKVVSKIMVERLKDYIPKLVSPFQAGFVPGRNIHENILLPMR